MLGVRWPGEKLYLVCDKLSAHRHPTVLAPAAADEAEVVFLPTSGPWLNWIDSRARGLRCFTPRHRSHSHTEQNAATHAYLRRRDARAQPKT